VPESGFTIDTDAGLVALKFDQLSPMIRAALVEEANILAEKVLARAKELEGTLNRIRSGDLVASVTAGVSEDASSVIARVFSGEMAANVLEYGATLPPHEIAASNAHALHMKAFLGGDVFAARVHFPGGAIKARPALHQAMAEMAPQILADLVAAGAGDVRGRSDSKVEIALSLFEHAIGLGFLKDD